MDGLVWLRARARWVFLVLMATAVGCSSSSFDASGGAGGRGPVGGTGGFPNDAGTGATGGSVSSLSLELKASTTDLDPGDATELTWTVANAASCEASGGWSGNKSADSAEQTVPVFRDTTYTLTCADGAGDEISKSVTVIVSGRLMATVEVSPNPAQGGERGLATVVVSNPSDAPVDDVEVKIDIPEYVDPLGPDDYSPGGTCSDLVSCGSGDTITWLIGTLQVGEVVTLFVFPTIAANIPAGTTLPFDLTVSASEEPLVEKSATTREGERSLALSLEQTASKAQPGDEVGYAVHYSNATDQPLQDVVVILALPPGTELMVASSSGSLMADGTVQWIFAELAAGEGGTVTSTVGIDPALPEGAQLTAKAEGGVEGQRTLATTHTALSDGSLEASVQVTPKQVEAGERMMVTATTSNRSLATIEDVEVSVLMPDGINTVYDSELSSGGACPGTSCTVGELATWTIGDLGAGESATVSFVPVASSTLGDGAFLTFETLLSVGGALALQTSGTAIEADRTLELRLSESDNPVRPGQALTYTLHIANQDNTTAGGAVALRAPSGTQFVSASDGGTVRSDGVVEWPLTQLLPGTGAMRQLEVQVDATLPLGSQLRADATATITGSTGESRASRNTPVSATALEAAINVTPDPTKSAERMSVAVTVSNPGSERADDVVVDLRIPQHLNTVYDSELSGGGACPGTSCTAGETATWSLGSLEAGASTTVTLPPVIAAATADGTLVSFDAEVRATDEVPALASATTVVDDGRPLELQLSQSANPVLPGTGLVYTLYFGNQSGTTLNGTLTLTVPDGTSFVSASDAGAFDVQKSLVTWDVTQLGAGEGGTRELAVAVDDDLELGSHLRVLASAEVGDSDGDGARASSDSPVSVASLLASVDVAPDPISAGQAGRVSVLVSNPTAEPVNDVVVDVRIPKHLNTVYDTQLSSGGACPGTSCTEGERASWAVGTLQAGESRTVSLPPVVASAAVDGTLIPFEAEVNATDEVPVLSSATTLVDAETPLSLRVDDGGYPVAPGATLLYVVHYGNQSATTLNGTVILTIPKGTTFESASDGGGLNADGDAEWAIEQLAPGGSESRELAVTVDDTLAEGSQVRTLATATVGTGDGERVRATESTAVAVSPLRVTVEVTPDSLETGKSLQVAATITNTSGATVNDIDVFVSIPQGLNTIYDADLSVGGSCPGTSCTALERATWNVGTLTAGQSTVVSFTATVANATDPGTLIPFVSEVTVANESLAGASATASVCSGATCPAAPPPNMLLCRGGVPCGRFDGALGNLGDAPVMRSPLEEFTMTHPESGLQVPYDGINKPKFGPDGLLWVASAGNRFNNWTSVYVYDTGANELVSCHARGAADGDSCEDSALGMIGSICAPPDFPLCGEVASGQWRMSPVATTHRPGGIYALGDVGFLSAPKYRLLRVHATADRGEIVASADACGAIGSSHVAALPPDPGDLSKEELYSLHYYSGNPAAYWIVKFTVDPPACEQVALLNGGNTVPALGAPTVSSILRLRVAPDGTIFFYVANSSDGFSDDGIWRMGDTDGDGDIDGDDLIEKIIDYSNASNRISDFGIGPHDGRLYVTVWASLHTPPSLDRVDVYDPDMSPGDGSLGTAFNLPSQNYKVIEFFPED